MKKIRDVLLLTCVAILYLKNAAGMRTGESSGTAQNPAPGKVRVTFNDNDYVQDAITPVPVQPEWLRPQEDVRPKASNFFIKRYARPVFEDYEIYTMTRVENTRHYTINNYFTRAVGPKYSKTRIPVKGELDVNVGQRIQKFKTYFFKFYDAIEFSQPQDLNLPKQGQYGEIIGCIYIGMKKTRDAYIGELYLQKRVPNNAGSAFKRAAIWPARNKPNGNVQVAFRDHIDVTGVLKPTEERPEWIESNYRRTKFESYSMYTMIHFDGPTTATYISDTTGRKDERVSKVENHIPIKARLDINVGLRTETFKTDRFENYDPQTLATLPFSAAYGEVIGYIIITIKGSKFIYVGHIYVHKSNRNNVPARSGLAMAHMMPDGHGVSIYESEPPLRKVRVDFLDNTSFEALLKPMRAARPAWMEPDDRRNPRPPFQKYLMYTVIQVQEGVRTGLARYLSESYGPEGLHFTDIQKHYVADIRKHIPVKAKLHVNVGQSTAIFKSYVLEPYNPYQHLLAPVLPVHKTYGEVFGYICIAIRGTTKIYMGPLHVYRTV